MAIVHVFVSTGRFHSFEEMRAFIDETYTEDGDGARSRFVQEVGLSGYEPSCIEAFHHDEPVPLSDLLSGSSCADQWLPQLDRFYFADGAICVFEPNMVALPHQSSLEYLGAFKYQIP